MEIIFVIALLLPIMGIISWCWISGIVFMNDHYPDYKGEDLFDERSISKTGKKRKS